MVPSVGQKHCTQAVAESLFAKCQTECIESFISKVASVFFVQILLLGIVCSMSLREKQRNLERSSVAGSSAERALLHKAQAEDSWGQQPALSRACTAPHAAAGVNEPMITAITWTIKADHWSWDQESRPIEQPASLAYSVFWQDMQCRSGKIKS